MHIAKKSGQTTIILLIIIVLLITITAAAVAIAISASRDTTTMTVGEESLMVAETGAENAILRLLRDPTYAGDPSLPIGPGSATISVTGGAQKTILSQGRVASMVREVQVVVDITNGQLTIVTWQEL